MTWLDVASRARCPAQLIEPPQATVQSTGALMEREDDLAAIDRAVADGGRRRRIDAADRGAARHR